MAGDSPENDEHKVNAQILATLKWLNWLVGWLGAPAVGLLALSVGIMVNDHFVLGKTSDATRWMKPKVLVLWMESHPELYQREISSGAGTNSFDQ